jgi:hypothetical protein
MLMDGIAVETHIEERRLECLLMSFSKIQKRMRKTRRNRGRNAEIYVIDISPAAEQAAEFHSWGVLIAEQRENSPSLLYDDFPELL